MPRAQGLVTYRYSVNHRALVLMTQNIQPLCTPAISECWYQSVEMKTLMDSAGWQERVEDMKYASPIQLRLRSWEHRVLRRQCLPSGSQGAPGLRKHMGVLSEDQLSGKLPFRAYHILSMVLKASCLSQMSRRVHVKNPSQCSRAGRVEAYFPKCLLLQRRKQWSREEKAFTQP